LAHRVTGWYMPRRRGFDFDVDFNILTALKGWVGLAPQGPGALLN